MFVSELHALIAWLFSSATSIEEILEAMTEWNVLKYCNLK